MHTLLSLGIPDPPRSAGADTGCSKPSPSSAAVPLLPVKCLVPALSPTDEFLVVRSLLKGWGSGEGEERSACDGEHHPF